MSALLKALLLLLPPPAALAVGECDAFSRATACVARPQLRAAIGPDEAPASVQLLQRGLLLGGSKAEGDPGGGHEASKENFALLQVSASAGRAGSLAPLAARSSRSRAAAAAVAAAGRRERRRGRSDPEGSQAKSWCGHKVQPGFVTTYTKDGQDTLMLDLTDALASTGSVKFVITAMAVAGTYTDGMGYLSEFASPLEETIDTMFEFRLAQDNQSVDVYQPQMERRTSDQQMREALQRGVGSGWIDNLAAYYCQGPDTDNKHKGDREESDDEGLFVPYNYDAYPSLVSVAVDTGRGGANTSSMRKDGAHAREDSGRIIVDPADVLRQGFYVAPSLGSAANSYRLLRVRSFPKNLDVAVEYMMQDGHSMAVGFSLLQLRSVPMRPRAADERLLYFTTDFRDLGQHEPLPHELPGESINRRVSTIWRYNVAALPDQQIRIYVDPTVPDRWRRWFREGVEAWNDAFALAGRPSAVRAVLPGDADWPSDYDISDVRFSTLSWTISDEVVSMGIAKVDPRSGEILKSDILMSDGWVRSWLGDLDLLAPNFTHQMGQSGGFRYESCADAGPAGHGAGGLLELAAAPGVRRRAGRLGDGEWGKKVSLMSTAAGRPLAASEREELLGQGLRHVVSHETGHILGLRHNFKGSMGVSYACTRSPSCSSVHGLTASVMDYIPANLPSASAPDVHVFSPVLGAYDKLAIKYGYMDAADAAQGNNYHVTAELQQVLREAEAFEVCYDEDCMRGQDPACAAYDLTDDPLHFYEDQLDRLIEVQHQLLNTSVMPGAPYTRYGEAVYTVLRMAESTGHKVIEWLGGGSNAYLNRRGDGAHVPRPARRPTPMRAQRRALSLLLVLLRPAGAGLLPPKEALPYLVQGRTGSVASLDLAKDVRALVRSLLSHALSWHRLLHMHGQEQLAAAEGKDALSCGEFLGMLVRGVMAEGLASAPASDWDLQVSLVHELGRLYGHASLPDAVNAQVLHHLRRIHSAAEAALAQVGEDASSRPAGGTPDDGDLPQEHLLALRQQLLAAVCGAGASRPCQVLSGAALRHASPQISAGAAVAFSLQLGLSQWVG